jgi:hypothetical protein
MRKQVTAYYSGLLLPATTASTYLWSVGKKKIFDPWIQDPGWVKNQDPDPG